MRNFITRNIQGSLMVLPLLATPFSVAETSVAAITTSLQAPGIEKRWNMPVAYEYASSLHAKSSYDRSVQQSLTLSPTYKLSKAMKTSLMTAIYRDDSNGEDGGTTSLDNTRLALSGSSELFTNAQWINGISTTFATNQKLREQASYQGSLRLNTGLAFSELFLGGSLQYSLSFTRNFHEFNINADGGFNVREALGNILDLSVPLFGPLSFQTSFMYSAGYTYRDDLRTKFVTEANLNWQVNKELTIAAGTSNEGNALGPNGTDSNIEFFNDNSSLVKLGLTYIL